MPRAHLSVLEREVAQALYVDIEEQIYCVKRARFLTEDYLDVLSTNARLRALRDQQDIVTVLMMAPKLDVLSVYDYERKSLGDFTPAECEVNMRFRSSEDIRYLAYALELPPSFTTHSKAKLRRASPLRRLSRPSTPLFSAAHRFM